MRSQTAVSNGYHLQLMNGVLFVILFASAAYQLSQWHYISLLGISPLIVGIVLGMVYGNTLRLHLPVYWLPGILFSSKVLLRVAIVLYGFRLTFQDLMLVGFNGLAISSVITAYQHVILWFGGIVGRSGPDRHYAYAYARLVSPLRALVA